MTTPLIKTLFANPHIDRRIEEVIKVDQNDEEIILGEIQEYVVTDAIRSHYTKIFEAYRETPNKPHEGTAIWLSGFFGSGKSSFAKMLGLTIGNHSIVGQSAATRFAEGTGDKKLQVLLKTINEQIPTHTVIFDVSTDKGIKSGNQEISEIAYRLLLQSLGYPRDLDLSELEIALEEDGRLPVFKETYRKIYKKEWDTEKGKVAFALGEASRVMNELDRETYPSADSWVRGVKDHSDIGPGKFVDRCTELMKRRKPGHSLLFVIDEVGQFVARDLRKMLDLQRVVELLGSRGRGKHWIVVTSQEQLKELVSGLDDKQVELARLMDRFPLQVHLEPSDISEVTSRRVLAKNASAQAALGKLFDDHRGRLTDHTHLTAASKLPDLTRQGFIDLYPLLPYQIELIILVVSGLRTQGGASKHVGGANRTIIKLAQQLLIHDAVNFAEQPVGTLVRLDHVYDLVEGNISSEVRAKITALAKEIEHPLAQSVAKVICLLQYVKSVHRTAENIAAGLHPAVGADSRLAEVKEALRQLEAAHKVRLGEDGYRIPTPAEDGWERLRNSIDPNPGASHRLCAEMLKSFWEPQPSHTLLETKTFKAGLAIHGRDVVDGDLTFHVEFAEAGNEFEARAQELRARSQVERKSVFWAVRTNDAIDREIVQLFRSREMLARKERDVKAGDETALIGEEKLRQRRHHDELRRLFKTSCLSGNVYFQGNDRSPNERSVDVGKTAGEILGEGLEAVFDRFKEAAARSADLKKGLDALFVAENLQGLPAVFGSLGLLRAEKGKTVFNIESTPLSEVLNRIEARANYGDTANGRYLADEFAKEPFGWDFEAVRLLTLCLLRAGAIEATSRGQTIDSAITTEARDTFTNNNFFKQATFRPKKGIEFAEVMKAADAFAETFGEQIRDASSAKPVADAIKVAVARHDDEVTSAHGRLTASRLPGREVLESAIGQMKAILRGTDESTIGTFNASYRAIKDAIKRASELEQALSDPRLRDLERARAALASAWPFLVQEADISDELRAKASALADLLARETFYRELAPIEQHTRALEAEYKRRHDEALTARIDAYTKAFQQLVSTPGWSEVGEDQQRRLAAPIERGRAKDVEQQPIPQLRSDRDACDGRLRAAIAELRRILDGERLATVNFGSYFGGGIETEEQLDAALDGIREECSKLIGAGKKVVLQ